MPVAVLPAYGCGTGSNTPQRGSGASGGTETGSGGNGTGNSGSGKGGSGAGIGIGGVTDPGDGGAGPEVMEGGCGDGVLQPSLNEACDDGNNAASDGCAADCSLVEQNFVCLTPGQPCTSTVVCGDSMLSGAETCDDGNMAAADGCDLVCAIENGWTCLVPGERCQAALCGDGILAGLEQCEDDDGATPTAGDGCDATCQIEPGWVCDTVGMACRQAVCGDGEPEGGEPCDDGDDIVGDGCSPGCVAEPVCTKPIDTDGCSSSCGDGMILPGDDEECDDGNRQNGDGCSDMCLVEPGYECMAQQGTLPATLKLPFVYRDFVAFPIDAAPAARVDRHPDFNNGCLQTVLENMVQNSLDAEGKPQNNHAVSGCGLAATCTVDVDYVQPDGAGAPGNCLDRDTCTMGETYNACSRSTHPNHPLAARPGQDPIRFWYRDDNLVNRRAMEIVTLGRTGDVYSFADDGFFPFDVVGRRGWYDEDMELLRNNHNFGFTTEVRYWFQFQGGETLTFSGDDDLFVFVNGQLALPIGSKHGVTTRTVVLNDNNTATCAACTTTTRTVNMTVGNVYEIAIFHAERQADASNFNLDLTGFVGSKSVCGPVCGDGVQTFDEACDDGVNDGTTYNGCGPGCTRGPYCGDAILQVGDEECDDGVNLTPYSATGVAGCAPGCVLSASCGDGQVDGLFGEQCDDGVNAGGYDGCASNCTLGPRCGDGTVQAAEEQCDDGNLVAGDGCSSECDLEAPK